MVSPNRDFPRQEVPIYYDKADKMNRTSPTTIANATSAPVAVVGADLDANLAAKLDAGDKVLVEINGTRIFSDNPCPLVAEEPWEVVSNNAPRLEQQPNTNHRLILRHPNINHQLVLHYANLLAQPTRQPAVFEERDVKLSHTGGVANPIYVMLQLVSHYIASENIDDNFTPWDESNARFLLSDAEWKLVIFEEWITVLRRFRRGWSQRSIFRMAMRAFVKPNVVEAFGMGDWDTINKLDMATLLQLHQAMHWLPMFLGQAELAPQRETIE
jgi:hypothetical protein